MSAFRLLGSFEVRAPDGSRIAVGRRKQRALLALLLLRGSSLVRSDEIVDALWGADPPSSARANLHSYVFGLRQVLDQVAPGGAARLVTSAAGYRLDVAAGDCDAAVFERLAAEGRRALEQERSADALDVLTRALELWRGPVVPDLADAPWMAPHVTRLTETRLAAIEDRVEARLALGDHAGLVGELAAATAEHPLRERLWGQYLRVLRVTGARARALAAYETLRAVLRDELGVEPSPELQELYRAIRDDDGATAAPRHPALLPPAVPDFTGRVSEVRRLLKVLTPHTPPAGLSVLGITGMAGVGKTTLAVHVAHAAAPAYPDGQLYVNLAGAGPDPVAPADVLGRFLRALGVPSPAVPTDADERAELYRTLLTGRRVLVVLDNAATEAQVRPLLPGAAGCTVLVTSRVRLSGLEGARWTELEVLDADDGVRLLSRIVDDARVDDHDADAAAVVGLCGGLPLAVRIAGARLTARPGWTVSHLVALLRDENRRLDRLDAGDLRVRASLALSDDGLRPSARALFRRLSVLDVPDFAGWLATVLSDEKPERAARDLDDLVDAHVLSAVGTDPAGQTRYRFHDLVRLYARDRAAAEGDDEEALRRGLGAWLAVASALEPGIPGPTWAQIESRAFRPDVHEVRCELSGVSAVDWFDAEQVALRALVRQACAAGRTDVAFDLAQRCEKYFDLRGMYAEWATTNRLVVGACRAAGDRRGEAVARRGLADLTTWITDDQSTEAMTRQHAEAIRVQELFREVGEHGGMADAGVMRSWALTATGRHAEAMSAARESLEWASAAAHVGGESRAHLALAVAAGESGDLGQALEHLNLALERARVLGNPRGEATVLQFFGIGFGRAGLLDEAEGYLAESLAISRRHRDLYTETLTLICLARVRLQRGDEDASLAAEEALATAREYNMPHHVADALGILGEIALGAGRPVEAVGYLRESVALWRTRGWLRFLAGALVALGRALTAVDRVESAAALREGAALFAQAGDDAGADEARRLLAEL
ncbi:AfsR/SARP family transcriptional regulator [Cryptosporangium arvum]|uniref:AfsR/SARP family transcriptional regulator n=1 Tax=Cryptosporangium arvum TaxID=80871 RepID=UPI0004B4E3F9|nr:BTAD domain-containing putative transcriptional regulator [Cryptosporangium arvum]